MTEKDLEQVGDIVTKAIDKAFAHYWENYFGPRFDLIDTKFILLTTMLENNGALSDSQSRTIQNIGLNPKSP